MEQDEREVNPVTGANWQATGVVPDIAVPEAEAFDVAYTRALEHVLALADVPWWRQAKRRPNRLRWAAVCRSQASLRRS